MCDLVHTENHGCSVQDPGLRPHLTGLQTSPFPCICGQFTPGIHQSNEINVSIRLVLFNIRATAFVVFWQRITIAEIKKHPWFMKNLPRELTETAQAAYFRKENPTFSLQTAEEIMKIVDDAKTPPPVSRSIGGFGWGDEEGKEEEEVDEEEVVEDEEDEYDKTVKQVHASGEVKIT